jgi:septum formation protein
MRKIVLASGSPRRKELLEKIGLKFEVDPAEYVETLKSGMKPEEIARYLSLQKAQSAAKKYPDAIIIAADTFGVISGSVIGKPHNEAEARNILRKLSGRPHRVITGFTMMDTAVGKAVTRSVETTVHFRKLTDEEIDAYVRTGEPLDKAGAYGIQGLGAVLVDRIEGDFYNVIGLPLSALAEALKEFGIDVLGNNELKRQDTV